MESCVFSYYISESDIEIEELKQKHSFGKYTMLTDSRTPFSHACNDNSECTIFHIWLRSQCFHKRKR